MYLLLYYLYCLCKSVQRSLVLRLLFFSKADAKVRTLFYIFQIFSEVFFIFFFLQVISLAKGRTKKKNSRYRPGFKKIVKQRCSHFESGCKGKNFISYTPNKSEVFFHFSFLRRYSWNKQHQITRKKEGFLLRFCQNVKLSLPPFSKADAKVADLGIRTKYTRPFLSEISKLFHKWLIDKQVAEHDFLKENKGGRKTHNIYTHARTGRRVGG